MHPRWIRVNRLRSSVSQQLSSTLAGYTEVSKLPELAAAPSDAKRLLVDQHIPNVLALPLGTDLSRTQAYKNGEIIFQDKASCFPAHLLLGGSSEAYVRGDLMDACAAPGNKTTHLASILSQSKAAANSSIFACERDTRRSQTLQTLVSLAGADQYVTVLAKQDFLALDPNHVRFANVTHLLLDPSCSGSGIVGRDDMPSLVLPNDPRGKQAVNGKTEERSVGKKRKREREEVAQSTGSLSLPTSAMQHEDLGGEEIRQEVDLARLEKLATLQSKIIEHAFAFPVAIKIAYSTCSIHVQENEGVVARVMRSDIAKRRGWRIMRREEQPDGLRRWELRGVHADKNLSLPGLSEDERAACIRCQADDGEGTMGFFVCGFVRDSPSDEEIREDSDEDWGGFSDNET